MASGKIRKILLILIAAAILVLTLRFAMGGDEDAWICQEGRWIRHGNPNLPMPETVCEIPHEENGLGTSSSSPMSL